MPHSPSTALVESFFDAATACASHVIVDPVTRRCAVIDSVLDFDARSGRTSTPGAQRIVDWIEQHKLSVQWLLETHAHADHLSAAPWLQQRLGGTVGVGSRIREVQSAFNRLFNTPTLPDDGRPFGHLFEDGETFSIGNLQGRVMHTPGHTPACAALVVGDDVFVGDTLFMPDVGTARCDFPGGDAATLYRSMRRLLALPEYTRLHLCHDYPPPTRPACWTTTVAAQRASNIHVRDGIGEAEFVAMRQARDKTLAMPALMLPAVQVNMRAGELPEPEDNGVRYLKLPLDQF
jgi:glyoxylase-like metal-dependent hydrolase (beta-lactamase superfamily II)